MIVIDPASLIIEKCPDTGLYVGYLPGVPGVHAQGETLDELDSYLQEVVAMLAEADEPPSVDQLLPNG